MVKKPKETRSRTPTNVIPFPLERRREREAAGQKSLWDMNMDEKRRFVDALYELYPNGGWVRV